MMAVVCAVAGVLCVGILGMSFILGSYAICEALDSTEKVFEK